MNLQLDRIQELQSVNEIYEYILKNSTTLETINKNIKMSERYDYRNNLHIYLCNSYVNKGDIESSLDLLIASNTKAFKLIYTKEEDTENVIQLARVSIYYLFLDYFEGLYDNEVYKNFGFRINGDIDMFKRLFLKENVDKFCSHVLLKSKQEERRGLSNRVVSYKKTDNGYKAVINYLDINFNSYEGSFEEENYKNVETFLYEKGDILEEQKSIEVYKCDNIYSYMWKNLDVLTDKQREFIQYVLDLNLGSYDFLFKGDSEKYSKELKCSYRKNIRNRFQKNLLNDSKYIRKTEDYYTLVKSDSSFLLEKIRNKKSMKDKFELIAKLLKKNNETSRILTDIVIEENCMKIFTVFYKDGYTKEIYRFINGKGFKKILERVEEKCI